MDTLSEELLNNSTTPPLDNFLEYTERVRTVLRGAREIGTGIPNGVDFLRADVTPGEKHKLIAYVPVSDMEDDSIRLFHHLTGGPVLLRTLPQSAASDPLDLYEMTPAEEATKYDTVPPSKAAPRLNTDDLRALHNSVAAFGAWTDWLRPYVEEIIDLDAPRYVIPATRVGEDGGIIAAAPQLQTQRILRPNGSIFNVGVAGLMVDMTGRVKPDVPEDLNVPDPIRSRVEELSERQRRRANGLKAGVAQAQTTD